ncbi:type 4 fimbrial biogenesis protein PilE [Pseudomonas matsuisoli]|uniref:Type 4 fimbrial biogenesis protein PilE n=2 Tax=Pseudomonas matsuisoli TaxID=1515666 RepID=A0A917UZ51_9PSED|nr:type IV pilin protein [Pseudomonas matsuisoli]GGK01767.1 type 4 fimbrial biogenesis protein PilE [Pseudomonas matsuisoli]
MRTQRMSKGFTLIEVMIVVVIIGILASIAYPSYQSYVQRGNRTEGMALLSDAAARQERYFAQTRTYVTDSSKLESLGLQKRDGAFMSQTQKYQLTVSGTDGYTLTATPKGAQANDTKCGNLTLNAAGTRGASGSAGAAECWR